VLTKAFSQVDQIVSDLALAIAEPTNYLITGRSGAGTLRYGDRLRAALSLHFDALGCKRFPYVPTGDAGAKITDLLQRALTDRNGPQRLLEKWTRERAITFDDGQPERYGLHLWLRSPYQRTEKLPHYELVLVGSSAFQTKEWWYTTRFVRIVRQEDYTAAQAVHQGVRVSANMGPKRTSRVWRGSFAIPITLRGFASQHKIGGEFADRLTIGALTLTTTRYVATPTAAELRREKDMDKHLSVVTYLDDVSDLTRLYESLEHAAELVLTALTKAAP
jgi:hypothetical protein